MDFEECLVFLKQCALSVKNQQATPRCTSQCTADKLDKDFLLFLSFAYECAEKWKLCTQQQAHTCKLWFNKLCAENYTTQASKRKRNIYLSKLILNIQDGKFDSEFLFPPPNDQEELHICEDIHLYHETFSENSECAGDNAECEFLSQDVDVCHFVHLSEDKRTYMATKPISNGVMCYVGVTQGGHTPRWINRYGEHLPLPSSNLIYEVITGDPGHVKPDRQRNEGEEIRKRTREILALRKPLADRTKLILFYDEILRRIDCEMAELICKSFVENQDQLIDHLTRKLQKSVCTKQTINHAVGKRKAVLAMLRNNVENQKENIFEKREMMLRLIEENVEREEKHLQENTHFQFIKTKAITSTEDDFKSTIWGTILNEPMHPKHHCQLKRKYCFQLVTVLQSLLKQDRVKIINEAQGLAADVEQQMTQDLQEEIQKGLTKFSNARQEWIQIQNVLREIDRVRMEIVKQKMECQCKTNSACDTNLSLVETCTQVKNVRMKLECLNKRNEDLVRNIKVVHGKIHHVTEQNIACQDEVNCDYEHLKFCVTEKQNDIREQELALVKHNEYQ